MTPGTDPTDCSLPGSSSHGILQGRILKLPFPSPGELPDPGSNPGLPHCRLIPYHLNHQRGSMQGREVTKVKRLWWSYLLFLFLRRLLLFACIKQILVHIQSMSSQNCQPTVFHSLFLDVMCLPCTSSNLPKALCIVGPPKSCAYVAMWMLKWQGVVVMCDACIPCDQAPKIKLWDGQS